MLVIVSPAKKLNMQPQDNLTTTEPVFADSARELASIAKNLSVAELKNLMGISQNLAELNANRFETFGTQDKKSAAFAFAGDTYQGLEAASLTSDDLLWAQNHLKILSGLYGILRPLDAIEPYRLEMGSKLKNRKGSSLYDYWGTKLAAELNNEAMKAGTDILINCASQEYFGAVNTSALNLKVITPIFKENKSGKSKIISFYAKKARGMMARFIIQNRVESLDDLFKFNSAEYNYIPAESSAEEIVFMREHPV